MVQACRQLYKNTYRYYVMSTANIDNLDNLTNGDFKHLHNKHWLIEQFHRAIKQVCNIEKFQVRNKNPIKNHIFCAIKAFVKLEFMRISKKIENWYSVKRNLYSKVIKDYINTASEFNSFVNA